MMGGEWDVLPFSHTPHPDVSCVVSFYSQTQCCSFYLKSVANVLYNKRTLWVSHSIYLLR